MKPLLTYWILKSKLQYEEVHTAVQEIFQMYPGQFLRSMQQFVLEEQFDILCSEAGIEIEELMDSARDEFITSMLRIHQANSRGHRKWRFNRSKMPNGKI